MITTTIMTQMPIDHTHLSIRKIVESQDGFQIEKKKQMRMVQLRAATVMSMMMEMKLLYNTPQVRISGLLWKIKQSSRLT